MTTTMSEPTRARAVLVTGLFVTACVVSLVRPLLGARDVASTALVEAARVHASALPRGGRVLVHPPWRDDAVRAIRDARIFDDGVTVTVALSVKHGESPPPLLVVADATHPLSGLLERTTRVVADRDGVVVRVTAASSSGARAFDLADRLFDARVHVERSDGTTVRCRYVASADKHDCSPLPSWNRVARETVTSGRESRACLWAHPLSGGTVVIAIDEVRAEGALTFGHALADSALRSSNSAPVTTTILVDGKEALRATRDQRPGFATQTFSLGDASASHTLEVRVTADDDGARHYCFFVEQADGGAP